MDWSNERYVRLYTRDTPDWLALGWQARAVFHELLRKVDRAGVFVLGKSGYRGLAGVLGMPTEVVEAAMGPLLDDACVLRRGDKLVIPNFIEAQEATQSDKQRQKALRERRRAEAMLSVTERDEPSPDVTERHATPLGSSRPGGGHVTPAVPSLPARTVPAGEPARAHTHEGDPAGESRTPPEPLPTEAAQDAIKRPGDVLPFPGGVSTSKRPAGADCAPGNDALTADLLAEMKRHDALVEVATWRLAQQLAGAAMVAGKQAAWLKAAIADAARDAGAEAASGHPRHAPEVAKMLARYCARADAPRAQGARYPQRNPDPQPKKREAL